MPNGEPGLPLTFGSLRGMTRSDILQLRKAGSLSAPQTINLLRALRPKPRRGILGAFRSMFFGER